MKNFLPRLFRSLTGRNILPHARQCGAILVVGGPPWSNAQRGVENQETFMNMARRSTRYYLAVNEKMPSNVGEPIARFMSDAFSRDMEMEGEVTGAIPFSIATACELAGDVDTLGDGAGDIFLDEATESEERAGQRTISIKLSSDPGITQT